MSLLPKNEPTKIDLTPKMFVIGGPAMSGKTFTACKFPNPILINTDGNCKKVTTPSIYLNDKTHKTYKEKMGIATVKDAEKKLKSMTRQELFDALLDINDGDYYAASAEYQTIVNGHIAKTGSKQDYIIQNAG